MQQNGKGCISIQKQLIAKQDRKEEEGNEQKCKVNTEKKIGAWQVKFFIHNQAHALLLAALQAVQLAVASILQTETRGLLLVSP